MRFPRLSLTLAAAVVLSGCFQSTTVINVNGDGRGTIDQRMLMTGAALAQMRALAAFGGGGGKDLDPVSEDQARAAAPSLGPGVSYVSSIPIRNGDAQGRAVVYAFSDVNQLRVSQQPPAPGGMSIRAQGVSADDGPAVTFTTARQADGNVILRIRVPQPNAASAGSSASPPTAVSSSPDQLMMIKQLLAGAHLSIAVEPLGRLVRTSSPFIEGPRVILLDVDFDQVMNDPAVLSRLQGVRTLDDAKIALKGVPGMKINLDPEITIEFTPDK